MQTHSHVPSQRVHRRPDSPNTRPQTLTNEQYIIALKHRRGRQSGCPLTHGQVLAQRPMSAAGPDSFHVLQPLHHRCRAIPSPQGHSLSQRGSQELGNSSCPSQTHSFTIIIPKSNLLHTQSSLHRFLRHSALFYHAVP